MPFPSKLLNEGEEVAVDLRPHVWYLAKPFAALIGAVVLGVIELTKVDNTVLNLACAALIIGCLVWFGGRYAKWATTNFVVTSDRVIFRQGVVAKKGIEIPLERINTVFFSQTVFERIMGAGDLGIESAGEKGNETFGDIRKPSVVQNEIYRQMELNNNRMYGGVRAANAAAQGDDIPAQIDKLDDLRQRGVISEQEFAAKKADLLNRM